MRVLYIARELHPIVERKFFLMGAQPDVDLWLIRPRQQWSHEISHIDLSTVCTVVDTPILYRLHDPHRTIYRTWDFAMRRRRPDVIHAEAEPDSLSALQILLARRLFARHTPVILHTWQNVDRPLRPEVRWVRQTSLRHAEAVLCGNQEAERLLTTQFGYRGLTEVLSSHGINTVVFYPPQVETAGRPFTITFIGRLAPEKALDTLLNAFAQLPNSTRLQLVGDGPLRDSLMAQAVGLGIADRMTFAGAVPYDQIRQVLAESSVVVLPSRGTVVWQEQFGRVLVESMACRVPVVGADSGAIPEVIGNGGLIFPEDNTPALASVLNRLLDNPGLCLQLGENGYQRVLSNYTYERLAENTITFYRTVIDHSARAQRS